MSTTWEELSAPLTKDEVSFRIDGKPTEKDGKFIARVVAYADVPVVVRRLDKAAPGRWQFRASDPYPSADSDGVVVKAVRGSLTIDGVTREDYGEGPDEKQALTDALKRTARLFGVALELWDAGPIWTDVSDGGKYAKIVGDPWAKYAKQNGGNTGGAQSAPRQAGATSAAKETSQSVTAQSSDPAAFVMPIGKNRGKKLGDVETIVLQEAAAWVMEKSLDHKYADFLIAVGKVLAIRELDLEPAA